MSVNTLPANPEYKVSVVGANGIVTSTVGNTTTVTLSPFLDVYSIISSGTSLFNLTCLATGTYGGINLTNTSPEGRSWSIYTNGSFAAYPGTLNFYCESIGKSVMTFEGSLGNVGINNPYPTSQLSVGGLLDLADNAAAITAGLHAGDFYYTNAAGSAVLKVVV